MLWPSTETQGVPQGCPLACGYSVLLGALWYRYVLAAAPTIAAKIYLDDRIIMGRDGDEIELALQASESFDKAFNSTLNVAKSNRFVIGRPSPCGPLLSSIPIATTPVTYLGTDLVPRRRPRNNKARQRAKLHIARCQLIKALPATQRPALVADSVASLWQCAGTRFNKTDFSELATASSRGLRGKKTRGQVQLRSVAVEHLCGPAVHRTLPVSAAIFSIATQCHRMLLLRRMEPPQWETLWAVRGKCQTSPIGQLNAACAEHGIEWPAPYELRVGTSTLSLMPDAADVTKVQAGDDYRKMPTTNLFRHKLRQLIRSALWRKEALRRPKDFGNLAGEDFHASEQVRLNTYALMHRASGPSLLTGGQWTACRAHLAGLCYHNLCPRCGVEPETLSHRLWECVSNQPHFNELCRKHSLSIP